MARTFTPTERTQSQAPHVNHVIRCETKTVDGTWQWLDAIIEGIDPLVGGSISNTVDARTWTASIRVTRGLTTDSLAPLMEGSAFNRDAAAAYAPRLNSGTEIRLWSATAAPFAAIDWSYTGDPDVSPLGTETKVAFWGRIDRIDFADDVMTLTCRDLGGKLLDTIVRVERTYGDPDSPVAAEDVAQQFLTDNADIIGAALTLAVPVSPTYVVTAFTQVLVAVLDALNTLALLFGWVVRYEWDAADTFALTLYDPQRDKTAADYTLAATEYHQVDAASLDDAGVRNSIRVWYVEAATGAVRSIDVADSGSIAVFGERFMQLGGDAVAAITNGNDALALAQFALADLSTPLFDHTVTSTYTWFAAIGDLVAFTQNGVHYDADQALALVSITHTFPDGGQGLATTQFQCRGKPAGAYERWLRLQGGPVFPAIPPAPQIDFVLGEADSYGADADDDASGYDGGIWVGGRMNRGCAEMAVYAALADGSGFSVEQTATTEAIPRFRRPEGTEGLADDFAFFFRLSTRANFYKRITVIGYSAEGLASKETIWPFAVQAVDPIPTPIDGVIDTLTVVQDPTGTSNAVTATPLFVDSVNTDNWLVITRNGATVFRKQIGTDTSPVTFLDTGLQAQNAYQYDAFIWNNGVSGPKNRSVANTPPTITTPTFTVGPVARIISGVPQVYIEGTSNVPGADRMALVRSINQINTVTTNISSGPFTPFVAVDPDTAMKWYKLIAYSSTDPTVFDQSPWVWWPGVPTTGSRGANPPVFVNGTPKKVMSGGTNGTALITALLVQWTCAASGAAQIVIQQSDDNGISDPWTDVDAVASVRTGEWRNLSLVNTDAWYRLDARTAAGVSVANSAGVHYIP